MIRLPAALPTCRSLAILLLLLAAIRAALLVSSSPIVAYANQFDQARTAACAALWPVDDAGTVLTHATPEAPRSRFTRANLLEIACLPSSAVVAANTAHAIYVLAATFGLDRRPAMDIRYVGGIYALILAALVAWNHRRLRSARARFLHALAVLLLLADPFTTLFFNTLYTEVPAVIGLYAAAAILLRPGASLSRADVVVFVAGIVALGAARPAHFALPVLLSALLACRSLPLAPSRAAQVSIPLVAALAVACWQLLFNPSHPAVRMANRTNAIMGALAPNASDPARFLSDLGLPTQCEALLGTNWFDRYGHDPVAECPQLANVSAGRIVAVTVRHPATLLRTLYRAQLHADAWRLAYVGEVEGEVFAQATQRWPLIGISFADLWPGIPFWGRLVFYGVPVLLALVALGRPRSSQTLGALAAGGTVVLVWTISVLGDGYGELARHVHLADLAGLFGWGAFIACLLGARRWVTRIAWLAVPASAAVAGMALGMAAPLALGYIDRYDGMTASGWVISSVPMRGARLIVGGRNAPLALDDAVASSDVARYFAVPNVTQARRWQAEVHADGTCRPAALVVELAERGRGELLALDVGLGPEDDVGTGREARCLASPPAER